MAVHHFVAADLTVEIEWQPMETFPRDGNTVEVRDDDGNTALAKWDFADNCIAPVSGDSWGVAKRPTLWRIPKQEG
jgi:hypothetical protein